MFVITNLFFRNICDHDVEYRNWLNKLLTRACFTVAQRINKNSIFTHCTMRLISNVPLSKLHIRHVLDVSADRNDLFTYLGNV